MANSKFQTIVRIDSIGPQPKACECLLHNVLQDITLMRAILWIVRTKYHPRGDLCLMDSGVHVNSI